MHNAFLDLLISDIMMHYNAYDASSSLFYYFIILYNESY